MIWVLSAMAGTYAVPEGEIRQVAGPAVVMPVGTYRSYVDDSRRLELYAAELEAMRARVSEMRALVDQQQEEAERNEAQLHASIVTLGETVDRYDARIRRLRAQRNVAAGIAIGAVGIIAAALAI